MSNDVKIVRKRLAGGHEKTYYYHRRTGAAIRAEPGTSGWPLALQDAARWRAPDDGPRDDIERLISRYMASPEWSALSRASKETRRSYLRKIEARFPDSPLVHFDNEDVVSLLYEWRDDLAAEVSPMTADKSLDALRVLLEWAKKRRLLKFNWAREVARLVPVSKNRAELTWDGGLWRRLLAAASEDEHRLLRFALYSAARESDIATMRWAMFDGEWLVYQPAKTLRKTAVTVQLPVHELPPFQALMNELPRATEFILNTNNGYPWSPSNIKLRFRALKARAFPEGDPGRTFHDIRGTAVSHLFAAGCSDAEVASIDGHTIGRGTMLGRYAKRSRQLAINAYRRWAAAGSWERWETEWETVGKWGK